ncbi:MAG: phosphatidate cytidylyltransferase [Bacteroidota bacterium]
MELVIWSIITSYFLVGAVLIALINKKTADRQEIQQRWIKYVVYIAIVAITVIATEYTLPFKFLIMGIVLIGGCELVAVGSKRWVVLLPGLVIYGVLSTGFYYYATQSDRPQLLAVYLLVFVFDGFSQLSGQLFGKIHFLPTISPNKTVEGLIGGTFLTLVTGMILHRYIEMSVFQALLFSIGIAAASFGGDVLASLYKRLTGVKDYSQLLPGHGGFLDRFDSYIAAGALYWLFIEIHSIILAV